jgi:hypothetical protein
VLYVINYCHGGAEIFGPKPGTVTLTSTGTSSGKFTISGWSVDSTGALSSAPG